MERKLEWQIENYFLPIGPPVTKTLQYVLKLQIPHPKVTELSSIISSDFNFNMQWVVYFKQDKWNVYFPVIFFSPDSCINSAYLDSFCKVIRSYQNTTICH